MKVLIATFRYLSLTGSETFTYTILKALKQKGIKVFLYSPFLAGNILKETKKLGIPIGDHLEDLQDQKFDVIHCHHNLTSILVRYYFPQTPLVYLMHGPQVFLEQPPLFINFNYYGALSLEIKKLLEKQSIPKPRIFLFPNSIDIDRFSPKKKLPEKPRSLLVLSNRVTQYGKQVILKAAKNLDLSVNFLGSNKTKFNVEKNLNKADIVISLGRGIIEAMACGKAAVVFGLDNKLYKTGEGMVMEKNVDKLAATNFSGRANKIPFTVNNLVKELQKYNPKMGAFNYQYVLEHFDISKNIKILIDVYKKTRQESAQNFDQERVNFTARALRKVLDFEKLVYRHRDFRKLLITRLKD